MLRDINPRHKGILARHTLNGKQYFQGRKLNHIELVDTEENLRVFYKGVVYTLPPTKYVKPSENKVEIQRSWNYDRDENGKYIGENKLCKIIKIVDMDELYIAVQRETTLHNFSNSETAHRLFKLFDKYFPSEHDIRLTFSDDKYVNGFELDFNGDIYSMSLTNSGDIKVFNGKNRVFVALTPESILSWFLAKKFNQGESGITETSEWITNSREPLVISPIIKLETDHLYNISNWISHKLITDENQYSAMYTCELIEVINRVLCERIQCRRTGP